MNRKTWLVALAALLLIGGTAGVLLRLKTTQRLGAPGVRTRPIPDSKNLEVILPPFALDYTSKKLEVQAIVTNSLPKDTSFGQRQYLAADGFWCSVSAVLMGADRTSIHKPQYCLTGQGWAIDPAASSQETVRIESPKPYDLPVMRIVATRQFMDQGRPVTYRALYVYWFVADDALSGDPSGVQRMWWMAREMLTTGVLQRWAYVSYFAVCAPGEEAATYERMKKLIAATVPQFQLTPKADPATVSAAQK